MIAPTPFFADRGCHVRILGEARALLDLGHEVVLCTYPLGRDVPGVPTERTLPVPWYRKLSAGPSIHKFYIDILLLAKVMQVCRRFRPDVLHAHLHEGIVIGKIASAWCNVPLVADLQGSLTGELLAHKFIPKARWFVRMMHGIERTINDMARHLIVSSTQMAENCMEAFSVSKDRITCLIDGVDLAVYSPRPPDPHLRQSLGIAPDEKIVVFVGVLTEYQGIDILLHAVPAVTREFPKVKFLIIGYPEAAYRQKARELGIENWTCFTGRVPFERVPDYLSMAQIAVSPKISTTEANLKLFNYMAMGLPAVVFDNSVNREILGDLGVYVDRGNVEAYAQALVQMLKNPEAAAELGRRAHAKAASDHSWVAVGQRLLTIYDSLDQRPGDGVQAIARATS